MAGTGLFSRRAPYPASVPVGRRFVRQEAAEESMANPIASGGPAALDVRRAPGIRTAAGRGYRPRGRPVLSLESRERAAGTMPAACPTHREIQSEPKQEALPPARAPEDTAHSLPREVGSQEGGGQGKKVS